MATVFGQRLEIRWKLTESDLESLTEVVELKGLILQAPSFQDASCADSGSGLPLPPSTEVQLKASIFLFLTRLCPVFLPFSAGPLLSFSRMLC